MGWGFVLGEGSTLVYIRCHLPYRIMKSRDGLKLHLFKPVITLFCCENDSKHEERRRSALKVTSVKVFSHSSVVPAVLAGIKYHEAWILGGSF